MEGNKLGRTIGYPTANIVIEERYKLIPADGIYAVKVKVGHTIYNGMGYIGPRPTLNGIIRNIEVNIFDFAQDIYNEQIQMEFHHFVRHDIKFSSLDELKLQLAKDKVDVAGLLKE